MAFLLDTVLLVVNCLILAFNITGNSLVIFIIYKKRRTSTDYLLLNLAATDLLLGVFALVFRHFFIDSINGKALLCLVFIAMGFACINSLFSILTLSVERYFAVCRPHSFSKRFSTKNVKLYIMLGWIFSLVMAIPQIGVADLGCMALPWNGKQVRKVHSVVLIVLSSVLLLVLSVLSGMICVSMWCKRTTIQPTAVREIEERKKKKKVTLCVLAVIATFMVCYIPHFIVYVLLDFMDSEKLGKILTYTLLFISLNSALDPYLFSLQNPKMKAICKKFLFCKGNEHEDVQDQPGHQLSTS